MDFKEAALQGLACPPSVMKRSFVALRRTGSEEAEIGGNIKPARAESSSGDKAEVLFL